MSSLAIKSRWASLAGLSLLLFNLAHAGMFDDEEARKRINDTQKKVGDLELRLQNLDQQSVRAQSVLDLARDVDLMKSDVAKMHGQLEQQSFDLQEQQKRSRDLYADLDARMRKLEIQNKQLIDAQEKRAAEERARAEKAAADKLAAEKLAAEKLEAEKTAEKANTDKANDATKPAAGTGTSEQGSYDAALAEFRGGKYPAAIRSFTEFLKAYPKSSLAHGALFWKGSAEYAGGDWKAAMASERQLLREAPDSPKAPDAMLLIASCHAELGDANSSKKTLENIVAKFPQSDAAAKAKKRLGSKK